MKKHVFLLSRSATSLAGMPVLVLWCSWISVILCASVIAAPG